MLIKRSSFRILPKVLFIVGSLLLVSGLLLTAFIPPVLANNYSLRQSSGAGLADSSSLIFSSGCDCSCTSAKAQVCNVGSGNMYTSVAWKLYFSSSGNPIDGDVIDSGALGPLGAGDCTQLDHVPSTAGYYAYSVQQEDGVSEPKIIYSNACNVSGSCYGGTTPTNTPTEGGNSTQTPTLTGTPAGKPTPTETPTKTPSGGPTQRPTSTFTPNPIIETRTPQPLDFNISFVCGYPSDDFLTWKVANLSRERINYAWKADGSDEKGNGSLGAGHAEYFFTSRSVQRVRLFISGDQVDAEDAGYACKADMLLSYTCGGTTQDWYVTNPNDFPVDYDWKLENGDSGSGTAPAKSKTLLIATSLAAHKMALSWQDDRPGDHTVTLSSTATCGEAATDTPTATSSAPNTRTPTPGNTAPVEPSGTPTRTSTLPSFATGTPTRTATFTPPAIIITLIETPSAQPSPTRTRTTTPVTFATPTATTTRIPPQQPTQTPTTTLIPPLPPTVNPLLTQTSQALITFTPTTTLVEPALTVTQTPVLIPVTGADLTTVRVTDGLAARLQTLSGLLINTGLFLFGLALALAAFFGQLKR
jgi:hypothetical protein